jgi:hypothetical protein
MALCVINGRDVATTANLQRMDGEQGRGGVSVILWRWIWGLFATMGSLSTMYTCDLGEMSTV